MSSSQDGTFLTDICISQINHFGSTLYWSPEPLLWPLGTLPIVSKLGAWHSTMDSGLVLHPAARVRFLAFPRNFLLVLLSFIDDTSLLSQWRSLIVDRTHLVLPNNTTKNNILFLGEIAGLVIGLVIFALILVILLLCFCCGWCCFAGQLLEDVRRLQTTIQALVYSTNTIASDIGKDSLIFC